MFLKPISKYNKTNKERYIVYRLCESYRINGSVRHYTIINFGRLEELGTDEQKEQLACKVKDMLKNGVAVLPIDTVDPLVEQLALHD